MLENRAFNGALRNEDPWFCTLELQAEEEGETGPILALWQKRSESDDLFYMVEEWPREAIDEHVRRWIEVAQRIGERRTR